MSTILLSHWGINWMENARNSWAYSWGYDQNKLGEFNKNIGK